MNEGRKECREEKLTHKKIDRALDEISRYSKKVWRYLLVVCDPSGVVRKGKEGGETRKPGDIDRGVAHTWQMPT